MADVTITVREGHGYLVGVPPEVLEKLMTATSYRPAGYQYTTAFKRGRSDGRIKLLKSSRFPAGLLARVTGVLDREGVDYVVDSEMAVDDKPDLDLETFEVEQRWYQDEAVEAALLNPRGVIQAPTGSGKTAMIARVIATRGKHALVIVPTIDLLHQTKAFLEAHLMDNTDHGDPTGGAGWGRLMVGQLGDGVVDPQPVTVATIRTAAKVLGVAYETYEFGEYDDKDDTDVDPKSLREWVQRIGTLICDEAHILGADTVFDVMTKVPAPNKYGFSASPWRDDGADLKIEAATGPKIYTVKTKVLVQGGFLVPPIIQVIPTEGWWQPAAWGQVCSRCGIQRPMVWDDDKQRNVKAERCPNDGSPTWTSEFTQAYREEIVENPIRNGRIAETVMGLDGATLLLVKQIKHGRAFKDLIPGSIFLSGKDKGSDRLEVLNAVREGRLSVLVATTIADLGLDVPSLTNLALAAGGKSSTRHLQRIGRVARPFPGKRFARVIDWDDSHIHKWFREQAKIRRKIERAEWGDTALWI
jgi:superfamily II DNA or RNA helicase